MRFRFFFFIMMFLYVFCQWVVGRFFLSLGLNPIGVYVYWLASAAMVLWLNLSFRLGLKRPFRLFPVFFGQFFFSVVISGQIALGLLLQLMFSSPRGCLSCLKLNGTWPVVFLGLMVVFLVSFFYRLKGPFVRNITIEIPDMSDCLNGLRVVQLSDVHVGGFLFERDLLRLRETVLSLTPDLLLFTGDMIDHSIEEVSRFSKIFGDVQGRYGRFLVMGNHEQWIGGQEVYSAFVGGGFDLLENDSRAVSVKGADLRVVGLSDPAGKEVSPEGGPNPALAFSRIPEGNESLVIVMAHQPDVWKTLSAYHADLTLSGHTHGGQIGMFRSGWNLARLFHRLDIGLFKRFSNGRLQQLFIHGGVGYFGVPVRLGIRPEVVVLTLVNGNRQNESKDHTKFPATYPEDHAH
jgi:hypothetical protein